MKRPALVLLAAAAIGLCATPSFAHASISPAEAAAGTTSKLAISIPHGCDGAATDTVTVRLPEGFVSARPQVKAGWQIEVTTGDYQKSHVVHGRPVTAGALAITWSGGSVPDDQFDEFVVQGTLDGVDAGTRLPFVVTQSCGAASVTWDQIAGEGEDPHALKHPAPILAVTAAETMVMPHDHAAMAMPMAKSGPVTVGDLTISGGFTRATLPNAPVGGGFLTISNAGTEDDRLVAATSPAAAMAQIHEMKMEGDVMKMAELPDGLVIPAGQTVTLAPGGYHIMFMQLTGPLVEGSTVPLTLTFEKAGTVDVQLEVGPINARGPAQHMHSGG